jgi:hypothetical protein
VRSNGLASVFQNGVAITSVGLTVTAGGLTTTGGSVAVTGNLLVSAGALSITSPSVDVAVDVTASQAGYTGNVIYGSVPSGLPLPVNLLHLQAGTSSLFQVSKL